MRIMLTLVDGPREEFDVLRQAFIDDIELDGPCRAEGWTDALALASARHPEVTVRGRAVTRYEDYSVTYRSGKRLAD